MSRAKKIILLILALMLAVPIQMQCGHLYYSCATAPDPGGTYRTYYEVEPLGITLIETLIGTNLQIYYWSGHEEHSIAK
jgi:hypothetical protein